MPQYRKYLGQYQGRGASAEHKMIQKNLLRGRSLANNLEVVCRETFLVDGSLKNQRYVFEGSFGPTRFHYLVASTRHFPFQRMLIPDHGNSIIKATQGGLYHDWRGPMLAFKENGKSLDTTTHLDMNMQDYRDIVGYFISYGDETVNDSDQHHNGSGKVKGVKISCQGDQITFGAEKYVPVDVPRSHMVFYSGTPPISELVGFPVRVRQYPPDRLWKDSDDAGVYKNQAATFLHQETDKSSNWWGWAPMPWQNEVGSVLVVRSDGNDVTKQQVEALCEFCQFKMQPLFENGLGAGLVKMTREEVMGYMTPARFREYFAELREKKLDDAAAWIRASLPK